MNADSSKPRSSKPLDNDHKVDRALLQAAIDLLDHARRPRSQPVPAEVDLSLPSKLIAEGLGEHEALARLAPSVLEQTAQLHHPGYFAHMDPPTPSITWAAALWQVASN